MIRDYAIIRDSGKRAADAASRAIEAFREGRVEQEPALTDRMLGGIEEAMREFHVKGIKWNAKTLTDRGRGSQEKQYGADFAGVLSIELPGFQVKKGFLAQAKIIEPGGYISGNIFNSMREQCEKMLTMTPDSFVFLYSKKEIVVVPAVSIAGAEYVNPHDLYSRSIARFFEEHFQSFIGDRRISSPTPDTLEELRREVNSRSLLYLEARLDGE